MNSTLPEANKKWYEKADELFRVAVSINPHIIHSKGETQVKMLIPVREKLNTISKQLKVITK
ncbi:MAG: hypothetical protein WD059_06130 [Balneolaceae bacterium]